MPIERYFEFSDQTTFLDEVLQNYDLSKYRIPVFHFQVDLQVKKMIIFFVNDSI